MSDEVPCVPHLREVNARAVCLHQLHDRRLVVRANVAQAQVYLPHRPVRPARSQSLAQPRREGRD